MCAAPGGVRSPELVWENTEQRFDGLAWARSKLTGAWRVPKTPFVWKAELGGASAFSAQLGDLTYYAITRSYGHPAYVDVHGMRGGLKRLVLGNYTKLEQAQQACERHYRGGCDLSNAERIRETTA
jgi:hypothetical protein